MKKERKPTWWKLSSLMIALLAVLFLASTAQVSPFTRQLLEIGVIIIGYVLIGVWVYTNAAALEAEAQRKRAKKRQPWRPARGRPGLNGRQSHFLHIIYSIAKRPSEE